MNKDVQWWINRDNTNLIENRFEFWEEYIIFWGFWDLSMTIDMNHNFDTTLINVEQKQYYKIKSVFITDILKTKYHYIS